MNKAMIERIRKAGEYQIKAILALLPESTAGHLDVIGSEMKAMLAEMLVEHCKKEADDSAETVKGVKKVSID